MLSHYRLYTWVSDSIEHVLDHPSSHWWYRLIKAVGEVVERGVYGTFDFDSSNFLPMIEPPRTYSWNFQRKKHDQRTANVLLSSRIIFHWLDLPLESDDKHNVQSLFLKSLMDSCGTASILLLDEVWTAYSAPRDLCSARSKQAYPSRIAMKKLAQMFLDHPILGCNRSLEIQQLIGMLQAAHSQFIGLPASHNSPSSAIFAESLLTLSLPQPTLSNNTPLKVSLPISSMPISENDRVIFFRDWLLEIAEAYTQSPPLPMDQLNPEQRRVRENSDSSCPFRELAYSRRRVSGPNGLFAHHTRAGTFSALLFRGILFNTEALRETGHTGFFESFEAWSQFKAQYADRGEKYICNSCAYGTTRGRTSSNDKYFWIASEVLHQKLQDPNISFTSIWQFIVNTKDNKKNKLFRSFGDLSAYLLTVDLTYARRIPWPHLDEVAQAVSVLAKGALHGLQKMNLVPTNAYTEDEVKEGFKALYRLLDGDSKFKTVKGAVVFDPFMVEHALCKISKDRVYERANRNVGI
ncbi:hypothetical protein C8J55DRAFT_488913 [Lentinula edodes]|uniref:Uncharacterized protein n=1 Tax=Lentinula lateritia TaxID=40482 RepID=A0A9W9AG56_9AGAR|nr:hypothetical protein C8J55DRAFT_488913 [Lentinula edodes]